MLDITKPPYNVTVPWQGSDASAPDYWALLQQAANDLAAGNWGLIDSNGGDGGRILMPPWTVSIGQKLVLPDGVSLQGHSKASSTLLMRQGFNPAHHFIDLGDSASGHASFGGQITKMHIASQKGTVANSGSFMIFSNNVQDTKGIVSDCIVDGGSHFGGIKYLDGVGGASLLDFDNLVVNSRADALALGNVPMAVRVSGSTMVRIDGFEPSVGWLPDGVTAIPGSYGLLCLGGSYRLTRFHFEATATGVYFGGSAGQIYENSMAELDWFTGGGGLTSMVTIENAPMWKDKIWMNKMMRKGVWPGPTVTNGPPGGVNVMTDIMEWTKF